MKLLEEKVLVSLIESLGSPAGDLEIHVVFTKTDIMKLCRAVENHVLGELSDSIEELILDGVKHC